MSKSDTVLLQGDCLTVLKNIPDQSIDSLVTDPPAGISFMGKDWDSDKGGRKEWIAWLEQVMRECLRVLKPGAHGLVWALPRTSHWTACALEDAGFRIKDRVQHIFGQGFPKSKSMRDIGRPELGSALKPSCEDWWLVQKPISERNISLNVLRWGTGALNIDGTRIEFQSEQDKASAVPGGKVTTKKPSDGFGKAAGVYGTERIELEKRIPTGRFPSHLLLSCACADDTQHELECAVAELDRQSLSGGMHAAGKARKWKADRPDTATVPFTGAGERELNRFGDSGGASRFFFQARHDTLACEWEMPDVVIRYASDAELDSLLLLHRIKNFVLAAAATQTTDLRKQELRAFLDSIGDSKNFIQIRILVLNAVNLDSTDTTQIIQSLWKLYGSVHHAIEENIKRVSQRSVSDPERATRFLYSPKVSPSERNAGLEGMPEKRSDYRKGDTDGRNTIRERLHNSIPKANHHPTVKPLKLMRYLIRLVTPPGGVVLDPFTGSGSTGVAALQEGFQFIGIEREPEYARIAEKRIAHAEASV